MTRAQTVKFVSALAFIAGLTGGLLPQSVSAETIEALNGLKPMSDTELSGRSGTGGITLPNGLIINVGIIVNTAIRTADGTLDVKSVFSTNSGPHGHGGEWTTIATTDNNGNHERTRSNGNSATAQIHGDGGTAAVEQNGLSSSVYNTINGANINQTTSVRATITNYYQTMNPALGSQLVLLRLQTNWNGGIH